MAAQSKKVRALIADDHTMFRQGLASMIHSQTAYLLVGEAADGPQAWDLLAELEPDVAIVDLSMPGLKGTELIEKARAAGLQTKFIILTMHAHDALARESRRAGASGCLVKDDAFEDLETAIEEALAGEFFTSRSLDDTLESAPDTPLLSPREKEIVRGIVKGRTNKELADDLAVSIKTIETHRQRLMKKLRARNTADIVRLGMEMGI